jgi:hypothetical protein
VTGTVNIELRISVKTWRPWLVQVLATFGIKFLSSRAFEENLNEWLIYMQLLLHSHTTDRSTIHYKDPHTLACHGLSLRSRLRTQTIPFTKPGCGSAKRIESSRIAYDLLRCCKGKLSAPLDSNWPMQCDKNPVCLSSVLVSSEWIRLSSVRVLKSCVRRS